MQHTKSSVVRKIELPKVWPFALRRVVGQSMEPHLRQGQVVIGRRWFWKPKPNDIVIFQHKGMDKIKRVRAVDPDKTLELRGDNQSASTDSRHFGKIPQSQIIAKVIWPRK